jgi:hypothetical protein
VLEMMRAEMSHMTLPDACAQESLIQLIWLIPPQASNHTLL